MPNRTAHFLTSAFVSAAIIITPLASEAGGTSHTGTSGSGGVSKTPTGSTCKPSPPSSHPSKPVSTTINNNINVYKPVTVNKNIDVTNNINNSKNITINKPVSITNNIDESKNIDITNNIDDTKTIDNSKNISINKSIVINQGGNNISVSAEASAEASASAAANATSFAGAGSGAGSGAAAFSGGGVVPEAPVAFVGGDIGNISVEVAPSRPAPQQCTIQEATIVKAIHAVCVSADGHEFPASHMVGDTWINSSYEGEVARCIPGSRLKVVIGKVVQSSEGLAAGSASGEVLQCAAHEAVRHYKDGMLKCAPAVPVPDCTERTNLRKYGTADMFFSYRAQVCLETHEEYSQKLSSIR